MSKTTTRPYRKRKRAQSEEETRRRITEAAVELHGTVGPAKTKVTDVAKLAGVSRMTVYNHFPTDVDLFTACSTHWATQNPFPDPSGWAAIPDPEGRLVTGLGELYGWYRLKQGMLSKILRDTALLDPLREVMDRLWWPYLESLVQALADDWSGGSCNSDELRAMLRLAVDFNTWSVLSGSGLDDDGAARLMAGMVACGRA